MAQIAIPDDLLLKLATCEANYANARRKGYAKSPDVIAAVAVLKSAYAALAAANDNLQATKGLLGMTLATLRAHRACRAIRRACVKLQKTLEQVSEEDRLFSRCLTLFGSESPEII